MTANLLSPTVRSSDLDYLHPKVRKAIKATLVDMKSEGIEIFVFEAFRSPVRQNFLYAQGRTTPGKIVTYARAWRSYHQYGLAADLVFGGPGKWTWNEPKKGAWKKLHSIGKSHGLAPLDFETPHLQLAGTSSNALAHGQYPSGGDEAWSENLAAAISAWTGDPKAPSLPYIVEKPAVS